jgi:serine protease Do
MNSTKIRNGLIIFATLLVGGYLAWPQAASSLTYGKHMDDSNEAYQQLAKANELSVVFQHVAKALRPSVVGISTKSNPKDMGVRRFQMPEGFGNNPLFKEFEEQFRQFDVPMQTPARQGLGSGIVIGENGHILTNYHVIKGADEIQVTLSDDSTHDASVVGYDSETDLAVLKIEKSNLQAIHWGDSDSMAVGEWVVAIGSPFGLSQTVTAGIVSALGRENMGITSYEDFIQTDAAINPGNSGGPLVNLHGELIGINTAIASRSGTYNGIGFAIPASMAKRVADSIIQQGEVKRGYLGVGIQDLNKDMASSFGFNQDNGILIGEVVNNGPADKAGIQAGDIVTKLNGKKLQDASQLRNQVADMAPGTSVELEVFRDGKTQSYDVQLALRDLKQLQQATVQRGQQQSESALGMSVEPLTSDTASRLDLDVETGVLVTDVEAGGLAGQVGIGAGDVILSINDTEIESVKDFDNAVKQADAAAGIRMRIHRNGTTRFVFIRNAG